MHDAYLMSVIDEADDTELLSHDNDDDELDEEEPDEEEADDDEKLQLLLLKSLSIWSLR